MTPDITLRDWLAGQALIGLATRMNSAAFRKYLDNRQDGREAVVAYQLADAMLVAREKDAT